MCIKQVKHVYRKRQKSTLDLESQTSQCISSVKFLKETRNYVSEMIIVGDLISLSNLEHNNFISFTVNHGAHMEIHRVFITKKMKSHRDFCIQYNFSYINTSLSSLRMVVSKSMRYSMWDCPSTFWMPEIRAIKCLFLLKI